MDHIDRRSDFPTESNEEVIKVVETAPISDADKEKMFHLNAEKLFHIWQMGSFCLTGWPD